MKANSVLRRMGRLAAVFIVAAGLVVTQGAGFAYASNTSGEVPDYFWEWYMRQEEEKKEDPATVIPSLRLTGTNTFAINAGEELVFEVQIKNASAFTASNTVLQGETGASDTPFTYEFVNLNKSAISTWSQTATKTIYLSVKADRTAKTGVYPIKLKFNYTNKYNASHSSEDTVYIKVENVLEPPKLNFDGFELEPSVIRAGEAGGTLTATMVNRGKQTAKNIQVIAEGFQTDVLSLKSGSGSNSYSSLESGARQAVTYSIEAPKNAKNSNIPLTLTINYEDESGALLSHEEKYYVNIVAANEEEEDVRKASLKIESMEYTTATQYVGDDFYVKFSLKNNSEADAKNIKITAAPLDTAAIIPRSANIQTIQVLAAGASTPLEFMFSPTASSRSQNYAIGFTVEYEAAGKSSDDNAVMESFSQYVGVNVRNLDAEEKEKEEEKEPEDDKPTNTPKIIVSQFQSTPQIVNAGEEFDLSLEYFNTNAAKSVKNIKVYLTAAEREDGTGSSVFSPVRSSNTFYIDEIPPKGKVESFLRMYAIPSAQPKTYTINVNFEYEDEEGIEYKTTELVGINVEQPARIDTGEFSFMTDVMAGQPTNIYFDVMNRGRVEVTNFMVKLEGDFQSDMRSQFFGNFSSGNYEYFDTGVTFYTEGEQVVTISLSYEDPTGKQIETVKEVAFNVMPAPVYDMGMDMGMGDPSMMEGMPSEGFNIMELIKKPLFWAGVVGGIAVIVVSVIFVRRLLKKRKGFDFDEQL